MDYTPSPSFEHIVCEGQYLARGSTFSQHKLNIESPDLHSLAHFLKINQSLSCTPESYPPQKAPSSICHNCFSSSWLTLTPYYIAHLKICAAKLHDLAMAIWQQQWSRFGTNWLNSIQYGALHTIEHNIG
jgi:hypothetical protein